MLIHKESHVFQDFAGHDLVVLTYVDQSNSETHVVPVFLTEEQEILWRKMNNEHADFKRRGN